MFPWGSEGGLRALDYFASAWVLLTRPTLAARAIKGQGRVHAALAFALISYGMAFVATALTVSAMETINARDGVPFAAGSVVALAVGWNLAYPAAQWALLRLVGRPVGIAACFMSTAYATAPLLLSLVPCCGLLAFPLWAVLLQFVVLRELEGLEWREVVLTAVALPVTLLSLAVALRWDLLPT